MDVSRKAGLKFSPSYRRFKCRVQIQVGDVYMRRRATHARADRHAAARKGTPRQRDGVATIRRVSLANQLTRGLDLGLVVEGCIK